MRQSETFQVKSRKRINDKCHRDKMEGLIGMELKTGGRQQGANGQRV